MHFSEDEGIAAAVALVATAVLWVRWYWLMMRPGPMLCPWRVRWVVAAAPVVCLGLLAFVLLQWADVGVRTDPFYLAMYGAMGAAWVGLASQALPIMGIDPRADVVERRNVGAAWAVAGALVGLTLSFAGGNIGDGPGWWVVVFSAGLGTLGMFAIWALLDLVTGISSLVTIERDTAAGVRLGALLVAIGLVSGRAVAGDWYSVPGTIEDFLTVTWPAAVLVMVEGFMGILARPTVERPRPNAILLGMMPAVLYLGLAVAYVVALGWWL